MKNETLSGRSGERAQPSSLPACLSVFFTGTMNSTVSGRQRDPGKLKGTTSSSFHQTIFSPICYMHPANPFNEEETLSFNQRQWEVIARQGTLPPARKTVNCLPWWIFGQAVNNLKFTSVSLYLKHKNSFWNKSVHAVFLSKNADFSTGPWLFWNQN